MYVFQCRTQTREGSRLLQDPGAVEWNYTGDLQPGWLEIQWLKINNLTSTLTNNPFFTPEAAVDSGGGFGLKSASV